MILAEMAVVTVCPLDQLVMGRIPKNPIDWVGELLKKIGRENSTLKVYISL